MTNTRDKLNEAKYFLGEMRRVSSDSDQFRYTLTAFLAAIRSITQIMQKEFSNKVDFGEWYAQKQREMGDNPILKYLHRQREITYHEHPVLPYPIGITDQSTTGTGMNVVLTGTGSSVSLSYARLVLPIIPSSRNIKYYFDDIQSRDKDVIAICREAVDALEAIVIECETKFCN